MKCVKRDFTIPDLLTRRSRLPWHALIFTIRNSVVWAGTQGKAEHALCEGEQPVVSSLPDWEVELTPRWKHSKKRDMVTRVKTLIVGGQNVLILCALLVIWLRATHYKRKTATSNIIWETSRLKFSKSPRGCQASAVALLTLLSWHSVYPIKLNER